MRALQGECLLTAWERLHQQPEQARALTLLQAAQPEADHGSLTGLPLAERNRLLLELRAISFGRTIEGFAECDHCGAQLEFALDAPQLAKQMLAAECESWTEEDREYRMRPANTGDLLACQHAQDDDEARAILLSRTLLNGNQAADARINPSAAMLARFEAINASAEIQLNLQCANCSATFETDLDIAKFLGRETTIAARRLLADIHRLASAYGWSEHTIANMSTARRASYLAMLDA